MAISMYILLSIMLFFPAIAFVNKPSFDVSRSFLYYRTDIRVCRKCNHRNKITDRYCRRCGSPLKA